MKSLEEYISSTPQIAENGGIVLGSKKTSGFFVDAKTGKVIHTYTMFDPPSTTPNSVNDIPNNTTNKEQHPSESNKKTEVPLYITRTDYILTSFFPNSDKVLWNMTVAEIGAASFCQDEEKSLGGTLSDLESSEPILPFKMPFPCQSRVLVYRFRNNHMFESLSLPHGPSKALHQDMMLPASTTDVLPSQPHVEKVLKLLPFSSSGSKLLNAHGSKDLEAVLPSHAFNGQRGLSKRHNVKELPNDGSKTLQQKFSKSQIVPVFVALLIFCLGHYSVVFKTKSKEAMLASGTSSMDTHSKRKKSRRAGKGGSNGGEQDKEKNDAHNGSDNNFWLNLNQPTSFNADEHRIGKLVVSSKEIAKGSNGTIVLEGIYDGRPVAVKRLVRAYNDIAFKEIQNLIMSDRHPSIVRWYGVEQDQNFVYLALERCSCSLYDLILMHLKSSVDPTLWENLDTEVEAECTMCLDSIKGFMPEFALWNSDGYPSPLLLKTMRLSIYISANILD